MAERQTSRAAGGGEELLTVQEVATRMRVNPETVRRWLRRKRIRGLLLGGTTGYRIPASEVDRMLREAGIEALTPDAESGTRGGTGKVAEAA